MTTLSTNAAPCTMPAGRHTLDSGKSLPGLATVGCDTRDGEHHEVDVALYPCTGCGLPVLVVMNGEGQHVELTVRGAES